MKATALNLLPSFLVHIGSGAGRNRCRPPQAGPTGHACTASADRTTSAGPPRACSRCLFELPPIFRNSPGLLACAPPPRQRRKAESGGSGGNYFPRRGPGRRPGCSGLSLPISSHSIRGGAPRLRPVSTSSLLSEKQAGTVGEDFVDFVIGEAGTALEGVYFVLGVHDGVVGAEDEAVAGVFFQNGLEHVVGNFLHA